MNIWDFSEILLIIKILLNNGNPFKALRELVAVAWQGFSVKKDATRPGIIF